jgi:hypothetical protein
MEREKYLSFQQIEKRIKRKERKWGKSLIYRLLDLFKEGVIHSQIIEILESDYSIQISLKSLEFHKFRYYHELIGKQKRKDIKGVSEIAEPERPPRVFSIPTRESEIRMLEQKMKRDDDESLKIY